MNKTRSKIFQHRGVKYRAHFLQRPFREGLEVTIKLGSETIRVAELGYGEKALIAKLKSRIDTTLGGPGKSVPLADPERSA